MTSTNGRTDNRPLMTVREAADETNESEKTIRRRIKSGELIAYRLGRNLRIARTDFELYLRQRRGV